MGRPSQGQNDVTREHWYRAHGLLLRSELALPEFAPFGPGEADVTIRVLGEAPSRPLTDDPLHYAVHGEEAELALATVGRLLVRSGKEILVTPEQGHDPGHLRLFVLGSGMGMLFHQRGQLVLHGAAIVRHGGVSVFVGPSGAGKSTLAAYLGRAGFPVLADDTLALHQAGDGFVAYPGSGLFKIWADALEGLEVESEALTPVALRDEKYFLPNRSVAPDRPVPLAEAIVLDAGEGAPRLAPVGPLEALALVAQNAYRPEFVELMDRQADHFRLSARLIETVAVRRLTRPRDATLLPDTVALLHRHWA